MTEVFAELGRRLAAVTVEEDAVVTACRDNRWFRPSEVCAALHAIATDMLDGRRLAQWMAAYPSLPVGNRRNVLVIMAGNIPAVGFFDLLCVCMSGHRCLVKPSSKDCATIGLIIRMLREIDPSVPVEYYDSQPVDAVIATGSDNTNRYFRAHYGGLPSLLRGSRSSVAVLSGDESEAEMAALAEDIFAYSGLGCRNVSLIFTPRGHIPQIPVPEGLNPKYLNNYTQTRAVAAMRGLPAVDTGCAILTPERAFPTELSRINYAFYDSPDEVAEWLSEHDGELQCVVSRCVPHPRRVGFGRAQHPALTDYPDAVDVMKFLGEI